MAAAAPSAAALAAASGTGPAAAAGAGTALLSRTQLRRQQRACHVRLLRQRHAAWAAASGGGAGAPSPAPREGAAYAAAVAEEVVLRLALVAPALAAGVQGAVLAPLARRRRNAATHCFGVAAAAISGASSTLLNRIQRSGEEAAQVDVAAGRDEDGTKGEATGDDDHGPRCPVPNRGKQVFLAKVAKQAERYNEMADHLELAGKSGSELSVEEHRLLSVAYKNSVGSRRYIGY